MFTSALHSLVFDCEVALSADDGEQVGTNERKKRDAFFWGQRLETLFRASCPFARELQCCVQQTLLTNLDQASQDLRCLGEALASMGYVVAVRAALSGSGADCFKSLRHEFLVVRGTGEFRGTEFIVEPSLRQHFAVPHPSPEYEHVLSRTPDVFVGGSCRLAPIVQLLCALMADSFQRQGLPLPPWRREAAMLSKWLPQPHRTRDTPLLPPPAAAAATLIFPPTDELSGDIATSALPRGYRAPPSLDLSADAERHTFALLPGGGVDLPAFRTDSDASTDSCDGFVSCAPDDGSPVSVLRMMVGPMPPSPPSPPPPGCPSAAVWGPGKGPAVQRGFEPATAAAATAAKPPRAVSADFTVGARTGVADGAAVAAAVEGRGKGCHRGCLAASYFCRRSSSTDSGSGSDGDCRVGSSCGRTASGLLSVRMQQQLRTAAMAVAAGAGAAAAVSDGSGGDAGRIRTRPAVHRGEMAIRVVKLLPGVSSPHAPAPPQPPPPSAAAAQQPLQQLPVQQRKPRQQAR